MVGAFLQRNGVLDQPPPPPRTIGGRLIETYQDFGLFLKDFSVRDEASRVRARDIASMTYLLIHSMAHHVMHGRWHSPGGSFVVTLEAIEIILLASHLLR